MIDPKKISPFVTEFFKLVDSAEKIVITSHMGPDDDSISSVLALYFILHEKYPEKNIRIIYSSERNDRWAYFENFEKIEFVAEIAECLNNGDLLIGLDANAYNRFSKDETRLSNFSGKKICIDHHANPPDAFDLSLIETTSSSNSENIYTLFYQDRPSIPPRIAEIILLGILGDTGNLRFINKNQIAAFSIVSRLVVEGDIDIAYLESKYSTFSDGTFTVMQELMKNTAVKEIEGWPKFLCAYVDRGYLEKQKPIDLDISAARNIFIASYGTRISGVEWSIVATSENDGSVKLSLRSLKSSVNVRLLVQDMGIGGGHDRAAGGKFVSPTDKLNAPDCLETIFAWMKEHTPHIS
jgi:phosphoesterase RecJ-like protein